MTTKTAAFYKLIWVMQLYEVFNSAQKLGGGIKECQRIWPESITEMSYKKDFCYYMRHFYAVWKVVTYVKA